MSIKELIIKKVKDFKIKRYKKRIEKAVEEANRRRRETGYVHMVLIMDKKVVVRSRKVLKEQIKQRLFKKGVTIESIEKMALYKTY